MRRRFEFRSKTEQGKVGEIGEQNQCYRSVREYWWGLLVLIEFLRA